MFRPEASEFFSLFTFRLSFAFPWLFMITDKKQRAINLAHHRPIRITYLVDFLRTVQAGTEKQLKYLLQSLPDMGYSVQLISLQSSQFLREEASQVFPDVDIAVLDAGSDISRSPGALYRLYRILSARRPDIVHTFFPTSNSLGAMAARLAGVRTVFTSRRDMGFNLTRKDLFLLRFVNRWVTAIIANAYAVREKTVLDEHIHKSKMQVIYNGIEINDGRNAHNETPAGKTVLGIVANLNRPVKRVDLFIRAAAITGREFPEAEFWIIGEGNLRNKLEGMALSLDISDRIKFLGRRKDVPRLLQKMTAGVICSDSEGLSNAIMEYMAEGIPVIATRVGGNPELVQHMKTGILVPPGDENALASAFKTILIDRDQALSMGTAGRDFIRTRFSVADMVRETDELYHNYL